MAIISYLLAWYDNFAWQKFIYSESRNTFRFHHGTRSGVWIGRRSVHGNLISNHINSKYLIAIIDLGGNKCIQTKICVYLNRISMEEDSSVIENRFADDVWIEDSFFRLSLIEVNGLPLKTGLKRSIIEISNSDKHGASKKLQWNNPKSISLIT